MTGRWVQKGILPVAQKGDMAVAQILIVIRKRDGQVNFASPH